MRVHNEHPHRVSCGRRKESMLSGKRTDERLYGANAPNTERKRSELEG